MCGPGQPHGNSRVPVSARLVSYGPSTLSIAMYTLSALETDHETTTGTGVGTNVTPGTGHPPPPVAVNELIVGFITIVVGVVVEVVVVELVVDEVVVA